MASIDSLSMKLKEVELKIIPVYQNIYFGNEIKVLNFYSDLHLLYQELVDNQFDISAIYDPFKFGTVTPPFPLLFPLNGQNPLRATNVFLDVSKKIFS